METDPSENRGQQAPSLQVVASAQTTRAFPSNVPIFESYPHDSFYVRPCFPDYYDYVMEAYDVKNMDRVTVTGPPGVGTSVFLAYFLLRFELQYPSSTFVIISYDRCSRFNRALLWKNGAAEKELNSIQVMDAAEDDLDAVFLLDGPPDRVPWSPHRYVACTSLNATWTYAMRYDSTHMTIYEPLWDVNELTAAVDALGLKDKLVPLSSIEDFPRRDDETEVEYRFRVFGGVAGPCLETRARFMDLHVVSLKAAMNAVDLQTGYQPRLPGDRYDEVSHELFHCYPSSDRYLHELKTASPYVTQLLSARINPIPTEFRPYFDFRAMAFPAAAALRQSILAARMLRQLQSGVQLVVSSLAHPPESPAFDLKLLIQSSGSMVPIYCNQFQGSDLARGRCYEPQGDAFESIHAVYLVDTNTPKDTDTGKASEPWGELEAVVFLAPSTFNYNIQGKRLYSLLKQLGLARDAPRRVALVFGVDEEDADTWKTQSIDCSFCVDDTAPVIVVDHVAMEMASKLKAAKILTVRDLRRLPVGLTLDEEQSQVYEEARELLALHENEAVVSGTANHAMLKEISQFVWDLKE